MAEGMQTLLTTLLQPLCLGCAKVLLSCRFTYQHGPLVFVVIVGFRGGGCLVLFLRGGFLGFFFFAIAQLLFFFQGAVHGILNEMGEPTTPAPHTPVKLCWKHDFSLSSEVNAWAYVTHYIQLIFHRQMGHR